MTKNIVPDFATALGKRGIDAMRVRNASHKAEYLRKVGKAAEREYGMNRIIDVVYPREPFIDARILIVPPMKERMQKYILLQAFGSGYVTTMDVVSLPKKSDDASHRGIMNGYLGLLRQPAWYYVAGGYIDFCGSGVTFRDSSSEYGCDMVGYNANSIAANILRRTGRFKSVAAENGSNSADADAFFDSWLHLFKKTLTNKKNGTFLEAALRLHKETSLSSSEHQTAVESRIQSVGDAWGRDDLVHKITDSELILQKRHA